MADNEVIGSKEELLGGSDLVRELIPIKSLGKSIWVREFTADEAERIGLIAADKVQSKGLLPKIAALVAVNEHGDRLLSDQEASQLAKRSFRAVREIVDAANRLSGLDKESRDALGKPSGATSEGASISG